MKGTHEYERRLQKCYRLGLIDRGCIAKAEVDHEMECGVFTESGFCDCDPVVWIAATGGAYFKVSRGGHLALSSNAPRTPKDAL